MFGNRYDFNKFCTSNSKLCDEHLVLNRNTDNTYSAALIFDDHILFHPNETLSVFVPSANPTTLSRTLLSSTPG